jgi:anti-sigma factor RsiW
MACEQWRSRLDSYADGELDSQQVSALAAHLPGCSACAGDVLARVQMKRSLQLAGKRYTASPELRNRIMKLAAVKPRREAVYLWKILALPALLIVVLTIAVNLYMGYQSARRHRMYSELADLHVATLASATQVDVVSTDRHTVKPWFQGKIPFTFNLPELQGSEFTLLGGRVTYLAQTPGAHLIYLVRKHEISVFIFQDRGEESANLSSGPVRALSFNVENWTQNGLRYFVLGDASPEDIQTLSRLLRGAQ